MLQRSSAKTKVRKDRKECWPGGTWAGNEKSMTDNIRSDRFTWHEWDFTIEDPKPPEQSIEDIYPLVCAYRDGRLRDIQEALQTHITPTVFNALVAGTRATAKLSAQYGRERAALDAEVDTRARSGQLTDGEPIVLLYDWLADHDEFRREVVDLSGSRTICDDEREYGQEDVYPFKG